MEAAAVCAGGAKIAYDAQMAGCTTLIELTAGNPDAQAMALTQRAMLLAQRGLSISVDIKTGARIDPVTADLDTALTLKPDFVEARFSRAQVRFQEGDYDGAISDYDAGIALKPREAVALSGRALVRAIANRDLDAALADCDQALSIDRRSIAAEFSRAMIWFRKGDYGKAYADFDAVYRQNRGVPSALYGRALSEQHLGRKAAADADMKAVFAVSPSVIDQYLRWKVL
jgi:tetratricopeptide (TPR) repeat protein